MIVVFGNIFLYKIFEFFVDEYVYIDVSFKWKFSWCDGLRIIENSFFEENIIKLCFDDSWFGFYN